MFAASRERPLLLGRGALDDKAIGEDVEIGFGPAPGVRYRLTLLSRTGNRRNYELTVTNDRSRSIRFEGDIWGSDIALESRATLQQRNGRPWWVATIPANGQATLRYAVTY